MSHPATPSEYTNPMGRHAEMQPHVELARLEEPTTMNRASKVLMLAIVSALGIWGCAGGSGNAGADRAKVLEARVAKLEEDFHTAATARDLLAQKLEKEMAQLQLLVKERDDLRQQVGIRTTERDTVQTNYDQFRKSIRSLLGETETASGSPAKTVTFAADIEPLVN